MQDILDSTNSVNLINECVTLCNINSISLTLSNFNKMLIIT